MSILRVHKKKEERRWSVLDNAPVENPLLSWDAKAVLWYLLTKPDDWTVRIDDVVNHGTLGRDGVLAVLKELDAFGYAHRWERRAESGTFEYGAEVYEDPAINPHFDPKTAPTKPLRARSKKKKAGLRAGSTDADESDSGEKTGERTATAPVEPTRRRQRRALEDDRDDGDRDGSTVTVKPTLPNTKEPNTKNKKEESSNEDSSSPVRGGRALADELAAMVGKAIETVEDAAKFIEQQKRLAQAAADLAGKGRKPVKPPTEAEWKDVCAVFALWKEIRGKKGNAKLTPERARSALDRLRSPVGFTVEDIANGIRGVAFSKHHSGDNERGEVYDDLELICRSDQKLETFIGYFERSQGGTNNDGRLRQNRPAANGRGGGGGDERGESDRERNLRESNEVFGWNELSRQ